MVGTRIMSDLLGAVIEVLFEGIFAGGIPGPVSLEGQRRARVVVGTVALAAILTRHVFLDSVASNVVLVGASLVAAWVLAFSLVDLVKELPVVPWMTVLAILVAVASLTTGVGRFLHGSRESWNGQPHETTAARRLSGIQAGPFS